MAKTVDEILGIKYRCPECKHEKDAWLENYGELNACGGEIKVNSCYAEFYDHNIDDCICTNFERIENAYCTPYF